MKDPFVIYKVYSCLKNQSDLFKDVYRWYPHKHFRTKQAALNNIKNFRSKHLDDISQRIIFKIVKSSIYDSSNDKVVYDESEKKYE